MDQNPDYNFPIALLNKYRIDQSQMANGVYSRYVSFKFIFKFA